MCAAPALAEPDADADPDWELDAEPITLPDPVKVRGTLPPNTPKTDPEGSAWVTRRDLQADASEGAPLAESLGHAPGLSVRSSGGGLQPKELYVRGVGSRNVLVTIEGIKVNSVASGGFDLSLLPEGLPGEVEIWRGAGEILHGSGAQGGVVSLKLLQNPEDGSHAEMRAGLGAWGAYRGWGWLSVAPSKGLRVASGIGVQGLEGDFLFVDAQGTEHRRQNNDGTQGSIWGIADWEAAHLRAVHLTSWTERGSPGPSEFPALFQDARLNNGISLTALRGAWDLWEGDTAGFELMGSASLRQGRQAYENPTALLGGRAFRSNHDELSMDVELNGRLWASIGALSAEVRAGALLRQEQLTRTVGATTSNFERLWGASFLWGQLWWGPLEVGAGVRLEGAEGLDAVWITRGSATWEVLSWLILQSSAGQRFRLPTFDELYLRTEFVRGSPDLKPETGLQLDGGLRAHWPWLEGEVALFWAQHDDLIQFVPASALFYEARNLSGATAWGVESSLWVEPFQNLSLSTAYTWTEAQKLPEQTPLPGRPTHLWDATAAYQLPIEGLDLRLSAGVRYTGERFLDALGRKPQDGWWWTYAGLRWRPQAHWDVGTRIENLLNINNAVDALQQPLPGISWQVWAAWRPFSGD